jgi:Asp-tRNA(Asn)/Glu-tRNA(Gln) amidotransferase A subunit family amidase
MAPVALGTETDGSILMPSDRASLYSMKITAGGVSTRGVLPFIAPADSLGPMTKSAEDVALMLNILLKSSDFTQSLTKSFAGLKIGFLDPVVWASNPGTVKPNEDFTEQLVISTSIPWFNRECVTNLTQIFEFNAAMDKIEEAGAVVKRNINLRRFSSEDSEMIVAMSCEHFARCLEM